MATTALLPLTAAMLLAGVCALAAPQDGSGGKVASAPPAAPAGQIQHSAGAIAGTVVDTQGGLIPGATIIALVGPIGPPTVTNARGEFRLTNVPAGSYPLAVEMPGFRAAFDTVVVEPGRTTQWHATIRPLPLLTEAEAVAELRSYVAHIADAASADCGQHTLDTLDAGTHAQLIRASISCVEGAARQGRSAMMFFWRGGVDTVTFSGLATAVNGAIYRFSYETPPCPGFACASRFQSQRCAGATFAIGGDTPLIRCD